MKGKSKKGLKAPGGRGGRGKRSVVEEALRQSEEKFAKAFHSCPDPICITTLKEGRCLDVNDSFLRTTGYRPEEVIGSTTAELGLWVTPEERDKTIRMMQAKGRVSNLKLDFRMKSGQIRTGLVSIESIDLRGEPCLLTVVSDITERKQAEAKYATIVETALDGFWVIDLKGRFLEVNDSYCQMIGYAREELLTMSMADVRAVKEPEAKTRMKKIVEQGHDRFETRHRCKDGKIIEIEISAKYIDADGGQIVAFVRDITERKRSEKVLRESEEKYRILADNVTDLIYVMDMEMKVTYINPSITPLLGFSIEEGMARGLADSLTPASIGLAAKALQSVLRAGKVSAGDFQDRRTVELEMYRKDGSTMWAESLLTVMRDSDGRPVGILGVTRDITARKHAEEELRRSEERYRLLFDNYGDPITVYDIDGRLLLINTIGARNLGGRPEDFVDKSYAELFPEQGGTYLERNRGVALSGTAADFEDMVELPSGRCWFWSTIQPIRDENGNVYAVQVVSHDITERKRAEEALRESEAKYSALVEQAVDGVVIVQDGIIKFANSGHAKITGYSVAELVGMPLLHTVDSSSRDLTDQRYTMRMVGKPYSTAFETRILCKDGTVKEAEARSSTITYEGKPAVLSIVRDITERKRAEEALRESEAWFRGIYEESPIAVELFDANGCLIGVNKACLDMFGQHDDTKPKWFKLLEDPYLPEDIKRRARTGQVARYERRWDFDEVKRLRLYETTRSGVAHLDVMVSPLGLSKEEPLRGYVVWIQDITERRQAQWDLQQKEAYFRSLLENARDAVVVLNGDGTIRYQSLSYARTLGYVPEEEVGRSMFNNIHPDDVAKVSEDFARLLQDPGYTSHFEVRIRVKDGSWRIIDGVARNLLHDPAVRGFVVNFGDVTERKRAEAELQQAYERETKLRSELEEEMKKRVEFTRALVHELKTPLTAVIASSDLLTLELPEGSLLRMAKNIGRSADNLSKRIDELLDLARGEIGMLHLRFAHVEPLKMLQKLADEMTPVAASQHQSLLLDLPPSLPPVWGDENRLRQVVLNLLDNACKFTGERGKIILRAREEGDRVVVEVEDTGPGISEAEQQRLFTPYQRLEGDRRRLSGLGLGLVLCKTLVELHGGQIWVKSQEGIGSTFGFSVPLASVSQRGEVAEADEWE